MLICKEHNPSISNTRYTSIHYITVNFVNFLVLILYRHFKLNFVKLTLFSFGYDYYRIVANYFIAEAPSNPLVGVRDQFHLGGLRSVARIFSPLLARKSSGFAQILHVFLPEYGYLKNSRGAAAPPPPPSPPPRTPMNPLLNLPFKRRF